MTSTIQRFPSFVITPFVLPVVFAAVGAGALGSVSVDGGHSIEVVAIVEAYIEATGGHAAYAKLHNRVSKVRVVQVSLGFEDKMVTYAAMPAKRSTTIERPSSASVCCH